MWMCFREFTAKARGSLEQCCIDGADLILLASADARLPRCVRLRAKVTIGQGPQGVSCRRSWQTSQNAQKAVHTAVSRLRQLRPADQLKAC